MQATWSQSTDIYYAMRGTQNPKVQKYLDAITLPPVYETFGKVLASMRKGGIDIQGIFDKNSVKSPSQEPYWNSESFQTHIRDTFPETVISDPTIELLWRSFSYYAYYPFPQPKKEVDFSAFQRAIFLLVYQCDDLVGTNTLSRNGLPWDIFEKDLAHLHIKRFGRIFRSIGRLCGTVEAADKDNVGSVLIEAADCLSMVGPEFLHSGPTPEQLQAVARRLFGGEILETKVKGEDVSTLMCLLARVVVKDEKWGKFGSFYKYGDITPDIQTGTADMKDGETGKLVNKLVGERADQEPVENEDLRRAIYMVPDLYLQFYQLWAILFQPPLSAATDETKADAADVEKNERSQWPPRIAMIEDDGTRVTGAELLKRIEGFGSRSKRS